MLVSELRGRLPLLDLARLQMFAAFLMTGAVSLVIGGWRTIDESGKPVDAVGTTVGGRSIDGIKGLRELLLKDPDRFPATLTEKLLAYALGRRLEYYDRPAVRQIVRAAAAHNYRWSSLILGIVNSPPFLMRGSS